MSIGLNSENNSFVLDGEYNVERIIDKKNIKGKTHYKVKWEGYPYSQCTWEPVDHLENVKNLINHFEKTKESMHRSSKNKSSSNKKESLCKCIINHIVSKKRQQETEQTLNENEGAKEENEENNRDFYQSKKAE